FNQGIDTVYSSISYTLGANLENLTLTGSAYYGYGNSLNNSISGNSYNNYLWGNSGSDYLYGNAGNDTLSGDLGNDYLRGGSGNDSLYGGSGNDTLYGNSGNDYLDGGTGSDWMYGGTGNDRYVVDSTGDVVTEYINQGIDNVNSSISYTLGDNLEHLTLTGSADSGYGNSLNNSISGNSYNNVLWGKSGNDYLYGNGGNDTLDGGSGNDTLTGGSGNDFIQGYEGSSQGELDTLTGGTGADTFVLGKNGVGTEIGYFGDTSSGFATITDFNQTEGDKVQLGGVNSDYIVFKLIDVSGTSALDTTLYYKGDLIAVLQDDTSFNLSSDAIF
ncbi:MAG: calcium-binding protein, partial [Moorea sp. SIO3E2]|nr:calcium-binding protein [Moorena sp. SIO3E2]